MGFSHADSLEEAGTAMEVRRALYNVGDVPQNDGRSTRIDVT